MYINILLPLFNLAYLSFFPFLSTYLLVLFSLLYSLLGTLLYFCVPVCALISFVLVDIILVSFVRWVNLLYFIFVGLIWFCLCVYMCIFGHNFYCCYKPLPLYWAFAILWGFPFLPLFSFFFLFFFFPFSLLYNFNFFKPIIFFLHLFPFCLSDCSFPLAVIFNVYKSSSSTSI